MYFIQKCRLFSNCFQPFNASKRNIWRMWNGGSPNGISKIEKLSLSYYSYNPKFLTPNDANPVIIVHGLYTSKDYFYNIASVLAKKLGRQIYLLDMRNHGESPHRIFDGKATLMVMAQDVLNFMDEFSIKKGLLIGHGLGGRVMIQLSQLNNRRIDKIISIDASQDGPYMFSKTLPRYLQYLNEIDLDKSNSSLNYVRLVMKEMLRGQVKNQMTLKYLLENIRTDTKGTFKWRFNSDVLEQLLQNWPDVKQINYATPFDGSLLNIVTKNNYITSEDYLDFKKSFKNCQVEYINSKYIMNNRQNLIKTIEKFSLSKN